MLEQLPALCLHSQLFPNCYPATAINWVGHLQVFRRPKKRAFYHFTSIWGTTVFNLSCFLDNLMMVPFCKSPLNDGLRSVLDFTWIKL